MSRGGRRRKRNGGRRGWRSSSREKAAEAKGEDRKELAIMLIRKGWARVGGLGRERE